MRPVLEDDAFLLHDWEDEDIEMAETYPPSHPTPLYPSPVPEIRCCFMSEYKDTEPGPLQANNSLIYTIELR